MIKEFKLLYDLLPQDRTIRKHKLARMLRKSNNNFSILFSLQEHCRFVYIKTTTNTTPSTEIAIAKVLNTVVNTCSPSVASRSINMLHTNDQIVLKHLLTKNVTYNHDIVISNITKLYTLRDLKVELSIEEDKTIPYLISNRELQYTYRNSINTFSSIKDRGKRPNVPPNLCYITDGNSVVMIGDRSLYRYFIGETQEYFTSTKLPVINKEDIKNINSKATGKYLTTFGDEIETVYIPQSTLKVKPTDWLVDHNYNAEGFVFKHNDRVYKIKHKVTRNSLEAGLGNITLIVSYTQKGSLLTHIELKEVVLEQ